MVSPQALTPTRRNHWLGFVLVLAMSASDSADTERDRLHIAGFAYASDGRVVDYGPPNITRLIDIPRGSTR